MSENTQESMQAETDRDAAVRGVTGSQEVADAQAVEGETPDRQQRRDERWRERARAAEDRADRLVRREVLRLLSERVTDAEALLTLEQVNVADLVTENGDVDAEAVEDLAGQVISRRPYLERHEPHHADLGPRKTLPARQSATWAGVISGR